MIYELATTSVMHLCLAGAALCLIVLFAVAVGEPLWEAAKRRLRRVSRIQALLVGALIVGMIQYGSTKNAGGRVDYPYTDVETRYLVDAGSYVTNDLVHIAFTRSSLLPDTADIQCWCRPNTTNEVDWVQVFYYENISEMPNPLDVAWEGAQTNIFQVFTTWTPGPTVHTNGIAVIEWQKDFNGSTNRAAMIRTGVYANERRLAPNAGLTNGVNVTGFTLTTASEEATDE